MSANREQWDSHQPCVPPSRTAESGAGSGPISRLVKVNYRPIEAAIRWSGLVAHESEILKTINARQHLEATDFPEWSSLDLASERIQDGIVNRELPVGQNGVTVRDGDTVDPAKLTIRHVDLKDWMSRRYPEEKPEFLFGEAPRNTASMISLESANALMLERETLRTLVTERDEEITALRIEVRALLRGHPIASPPQLPAEAALSPRAERTFLHIIGGQLALLLSKEPSARPYPRFRTQEEVIVALIDQYGERLGLSKSTLEAKFAAAKRLLSSDRP